MNKRKDFFFFSLSKVMAWSFWNDSENKNIKGGGRIFISTYAKWWLSPPTDLRLHVFKINIPSLSLSLLLCIYYFSYAIFKGGKAKIKERNVEALMATAMRVEMITNGWRAKRSSAQVKVTNENGRWKFSLYPSRASLFISLGSDQVLRHPTHLKRISRYRKRNLSLSPFCQNVNASTCRHAVRDF